MSITKKDVKHIARLSRIEIGEAEEAKFEKNLGSILDFINRLNEVDTSNILPVAGGILPGKFKALDDETRQDEIAEKLGDSGGLVEAAPGKKEEWVAVKAIF